VSDSFDVQLSGLRRRFWDRAIGQCADLEKIVSELEHGGDSTRLGAKFREIAHSLAGAGGTFGFAELSALAGESDEFARGSPGAVALARACRALISGIQRVNFPRSSPDGDS
jgi:chemotaxis protein histidine kinase CheA